MLYIFLKPLAVSKFSDVTLPTKVMPLNQQYKYIFVILVTTLNHVNNQKTINYNSTVHTTPKCPFTKLVEDIFKMRNQTNLSGTAGGKLILNSLADVTTDIKNSNKSLQDALVNDIIASINRIKNNITQTNDEERNLNEAIILNVPKPLEKAKRKNDEINITGIKSGMEDKYDVKLNISKDNNNNKTQSISSTTTEKTNYVEILTIEPNNTNINQTTSLNIIEVLKHLMPMFNSTLTKEMHNITIIERDHHKNHSFSATKNISTIVVVTYCDNENYTKINNTSVQSSETELKRPDNSTDDDYFVDDDDYDYEDFVADVNLTKNEKRDIMEAAEYGMQKMHELYAVMEPKLYSMGLWLDDSNPARYVAAFNAPSEDAAKFYRYGYASLQAAEKLKQLTSGDGLEGRTDDPQFPAASALRQSPLLQHCPLRGSPKCPPASKRYRTHDGTCNNLNRPRWGSTMTPVQRFLPPSYSDGIQAPRRSVFGSSLPSAREISSSVHEDQYIEVPGITHLLMQWGQFLDHDVTSSSQSRGFNGSVPRCCKDGGRDFVPKEFLHPECMPIEVPPTDPFYGPKGVRCLDFVRSSPAPRDDCALGWREQMNQVSAYIDGSPLYASSARQSDKLRLFRNGMLQYGRVQNRRPLLPPERRDELCRGGAVSSDCFKSGDARVNEHPGLVAAHIVWLRQHNRMAQELAHLNPHWSDEKVYQETRKIVGAMIQHITYREFLPIVLGQEVMRLFDLEPLRKGYYEGYSPKINPSPASSFGSAAFRFGHSLVQPSMVRYDRFHRPMQNNVSLHDELTNPSNIWSMGAVDRLLLGMVNQPIQKRDEFITEELTNHLFQTPSFNFGMDLAAINIQRGRDHGIAPYTAWREPCGLSPINEFEDLFRVMSPRAARRLQRLYRHVDDIDLFTAGMSERPVVGGLVGPTFSCIIAQQFSNLRKGDRFWYENGGLESSLTPAQLQQIRRISLAQILCRTLDTIDSIQPFVFLSADNTDNDRISCLNGLLNNFDLSPWTDVNSSNDISKADEVSTERPKRKTTTTTKRPTTKKLQKLSITKVPLKKPVTAANNTPSVTKPRPAQRQNKTDKISDKLDTTLTTENVTTIAEPTVQKIDDKLDFKNKSRRYEDSNARLNYNKPTNQYGTDYDDDEDVHSVQSVVINNLQHKRPYNRPVIAVTENIDKYTYLINYVPRPTQSWRDTTRRKTTRRTTTRRPYDGDVVKVTYQTYDDTYRRPNNPYYYNRHDNYDRQEDENDKYNRQDDIRDSYKEQDKINEYYKSQGDKNDNYDYKSNRPNTNDDHFSSARSNDQLLTTTTKTDATIEKIAVTDNMKPTTENSYKLVTFGYVGTYKGDATNYKETKTDSTEKIVKHDIISKDFSTYEDDRLDTNEKKDTLKLSTFFHYETATKPYSNLRPTRRNDDDEVPDYSKTNSKYYFVRNVLRKYPDNRPTITGTALDTTDSKEILKENYNSPGHPVAVLIEERSSADKLALLEAEEAKLIVPEPERFRLAAGQAKQSSPAKTPSVAFQVIPSENNPSQWATYHEKDLPEGLPHRMPPIKADPYALKEIPRPFNFGNLKRRRPGRRH